LHQWSLEDQQTARIRFDFWTELSPKQKEALIKLDPNFHKKNAGEKIKLLSAYEQYKKNPAEKIFAVSWSWKEARQKLELSRNVLYWYGLSAERKLALRKNYSRHNRSSCGIKSRISKHFENFKKLGELRQKQILKNFSEYKALPKALQAERRNKLNKKKDS